MEQGNSDLPRKHCKKWILEAPQPKICFPIHVSLANLMFLTAILTLSSLREYTCMSILIPFSNTVCSKKVQVIPKSLKDIWLYFLGHTMLIHAFKYICLGNWLFRYPIRIFTWSTCFIAAIPFLTKGSGQLNFLVFVQVWYIQLCLDKLLCFSINSHGKSVLSRTNFNLNTREGFKNVIKQDLVENKSWLKVVCMHRNIKCDGVYTKLHVSPLNKYVESWILQTNILSVAHFKHQNFILVYISKEPLKHFLAALFPDVKCSP